MNAVHAANCPYDGPDGAWGCTCGEIEYTDAVCETCGYALNEFGECFECDELPGDNE